MRDYNMTDREQVEMIKQWWQDYGKFLAIAILAGVIIALAWRSWHQHQFNNSIQASSLYQQLLLADAKMDTGSTKQIAKVLTTQYATSPYAVMAKLLLAKEAVQENKLELGLHQLNWIIAHSRDASFRQIARIRVARILLAQQQPQPALHVLAVLDDDTFQAEINAVKGDIYMSMGDIHRARDAYSQAQQQFAANSIGDNIMQLKLAQPINSH